MGSRRISLRVSMGSIRVLYKDSFKGSMGSVKALYEGSLRVIKGFDRGFRKLSGPSLGA